MDHSRLNNYDSEYSHEAEIIIYNRVSYYYEDI